MSGLNSLVAGREIASNGAGRDGRLVITHAIAVADPQPMPRPFGRSSRKLRCPSLMSPAVAPPSSS